MTSGQAQWTVMEPQEILVGAQCSTLQPAVLAELLDAADAANDLALAVAHARHLETQADTAWQRAIREPHGDGPSRQNAALAIAGAAGRYGEQLLRVYTRQALHFTRLAVAALAAQSSASALVAQPVAPILAVSEFEADQRLPAPPWPYAGLGPDGSESDVMQSYRHATRSLTKGLDVGVVDLSPDDQSNTDDPDFDIWASGSAEVAAALHRYANLALAEAAAQYRQHGTTPATS